MCIAKGLTDEQKKLIIRNCYKMTITEMSEALGINSQKIRTFLNTNKCFYKKVYGVYTNELTPRELEILELMSKGFDNEEIAEKLIIGINTIKTHLAHIFIKMGVKKAPASVQRVRAVLMYLGKVEK